MIDDRVINGVLCYYKDKKWTPYTIKALTTAFVATSGLYESEHSRAMKLAKKISEIERVLKG